MQRVVRSRGGTSERQDTRYSMSVLDCLGSVLHERTSSSSYDDFSLFSLQHCNSPSFPVSLHCRALFQPIFDAASGSDMRLTKHPRCIFTPPPERLGCEDGQTHCHWPLAGHWAGLPIASQVVDRVGRHEVRLQSDDITL